MEKRLSQKSLSLLREEVEMHYMIGQRDIAVALEMLLNWYDECVNEQGQDNGISKE